jgi:putative MATE family efflux protein
VNASAHDLTDGTISRKLFQLAGPIAIGMLLQSLYVLVDLYFVGRLGNAAVAGVGLASNIQFLVIALCQVVSVGAVALISQAAGRKDASRVQDILRASLVVAFLGSALTLLAGYLLLPAYLRGSAASIEAAAAGRRYLFAFLPGLALQYPLAALGAALRGNGIVKPIMLVQLMSVLLNAVLAPLLIAGMGLGTMGAGLASTLSIVAGVMVAWKLFNQHMNVPSNPLSLRRVDGAILARMLGIGLPAGAEFALLFGYAALAYLFLERFGPSAQAGYGIGSRLIQSLFLPAIAISQAAAAIAGQNVGARQTGRVVQTLKASALWAAVPMLVLALAVQAVPAAFAGPFTHDAATLHRATEYLQIAAWAMVLGGLNMVLSSFFQALGNTLPSLASNAIRLAVFAGVGFAMSRQAHFQLTDLWILSVAATGLQTVMSGAFLHALLKRWAAGPAGSMTEVRSASQG